MSENFIGRCGWAALIGFALTCWVGVMLGTPLGMWLRLLSHFVSAAILVMVLTSFLEQGLPAALCLAAYGALLGVVWGGVARIIRFAELNHDTLIFPCVRLSPTARLVAIAVVLAWPHLHRTTIDERGALDGFVHLESIADRAQNLSFLFYSDLFVKEPVSC